jgi:hypothetical protein
MRVQRTRSSPSALRSPLTRHPLGGLMRGMALLVLCSGMLCGQESTTQIPSDFHWQSIPEVKVKLLVPDGWHFNAVKGSDQTYVVTLEDYAKTGRYDTGARLVVDHVTADHDVLAVAEQQVQLAAQAGEVVEPVFSEEMGAIRGFGCIVRIKRSDMDMTVAYSRIANPKTKALYSIQFQSPSAMWPGTWERGRWIIGKIKLDDEF